MKTTTLIFAIVTLTFFAVPFNYGNANNKKIEKSELYLKSGNYQVHGSFLVLFTNPEYTCHGFEATGDWEAHTCNCCKKTYYTQPFKDKVGNQYLMYSYSKCDSSNTGYHDYKKLDDIYPCGCSKDIYVKE